MSLSDDLLIILTDYSGGYRLMRKRMAGYTGPVGKRMPPREVGDDTLRVTLSRLKKQGLVKNNGGIWAITAKGRDFLMTKLTKKPPRFVYQNRKSSAKKNTIIIFDIPESDRRKRDWLRGELTALKFIKLQKSVWFGSSPLPNDFIAALNEFNLLRYVKFFKATEEEII